MTLPSDQSPLFVLAFDHRAVLRSMFDYATDVQYAESKMLVLDAISAARERGARDCGYLVDEEYGAQAARAAKQRGITLVMPAEASRTPEIELQYGDDFGAHIEAFEPDIVKTLIFHSTSDAPDRKKRQFDTMARLRSWCTDNGYPLMIEVLIPQLVAASPYDHGEVLFRELLNSVAELQANGFEADTWKIDGLDTAEHAELIAEQAAKQELPTSCIILGSGASMDDVSQWVGNAGQARGYRGFAVGRSVWAQSLGAYFDGSLGYDDAVSTIADAYLGLQQTYLNLGANQ